MRDGKFWEEEKKRTCKLRGRERESWEGCREWRKKGERSWQQECRRILREDGKGEKWLRKIEEKRKKSDRGRGKEEE